MLKFSTKIKKNLPLFHSIIYLQNMKHTPRKSEQAMVKIFNTLSLSHFFFGSIIKKRSSCFSVFVAKIINRWKR